MRSAFLLAFCAFPAGAATPLDPEFKAPLHWRIVMDAPEHPLIPAEFRTQLCSDVRTALQTGFGKDLCRVEFIDLAMRKPETWEPLWKAFHERGWLALENESPRPLDGVKTHFFKLSILDGKSYRLEARQHDGFTGLTSLGVSRRDTASPELVGRLAGLMLAPDYGAVGTVAPIPGDAKQVRIRLRGGLLPGAEKLVQQGDVFAFSTVTAKENTALLGREMPFTYLRAVGPVVEGEVRCELLSRYRQPLEERRGVAGYRCMKIAPPTAAVRLKIVDKNGVPAPADAPFDLWTADTGFLPGRLPRDGFSYSEGVFTSLRPMQKLACVVVKLGSAKAEVFVLPVGRAGDPPAELRMDVKPDDIARAEFEQSCEGVRKKAAEAAIAQVELRRKLGQLIGEAKNEAALAQATDGLKAADANEKTLLDDIATLRKSPLAADGTAAKLLALGEKQVLSLRADRPELETTIANLRSALAKANDPVRFEREFRAKELARQIEYHTGRGEVPAALEIYDRLIALTQQADLPAKKAALEAQWKPKREAHATARKVLLEEWRKAVTLEEFQSAMPKLKPMIEEFAKNSDKFGLRNFQNSLPTAYARLAEIAGALDESVPANRESLKLIKLIDEAIRTADDAATVALK